MIGEIVQVVVDRPLGSCHPQWTELWYPLNYGYVPGIMAPDGGGPGVKGGGIAPRPVLCYNKLLPQV